ncbi:MULTISPECIES: OmpA family protein [Acinetobacter]|jgi:OOP family OmpA-OmpF porin|uniref:OmpA family protein n=1 Tax=Acinetobacter TaxID=469 RepID=UPI0015D21992|nr:OmpA family protein [Acinetobacter sp. YH12108]
MKTSTLLRTAILCMPFIFAACSKTEQAETSKTEIQQEDTTQAAETAPAQAFDISKIPLSTATLGDFPYISLPDGYIYQNTEQRNFERVPFWTGQQLEWVEGKLFSSGITSKPEYKEGNFLEIQRNLESVIKDLGGVEIANSQIPKDIIEKIPKDFQVQYYAGLGDIFNYPTKTYVVRQEDKTAWFQLTQSGNYISLMVAESKPLNVTAKALTSSALKQSLDQDNKVSVQINFATDKAEILPDSQDQIEQIVALLKDNPELKLGIYGHTDNSGDAAHNLKLSDQRAQSVVSALAKAGIESSRLTAKGFGDIQPVADNASEDGKAKNRRVELVKL